MSDTAPRRRWFQFSLWAIFVAVTMAAIPVAFIAWVNHALIARAQRRAAPFTNENLDLIIRGTLSNAAIQPIKPRFVQIGPNTTKVIGAVSIIDDNELDDLIRALTPIEFVSEGALPVGTADYELYFQGGMDPAVIYVKIVGDKLEFQERGFVYQGGNAAAFRQTAEKILEREMQVSVK